MFVKFMKFPVLALSLGLVTACSTSFNEVGIMHAAETRRELRCYQYKTTDAMMSQRVFSCIDYHAKPLITSTGVGTGPAGLAAGVLGSALQGVVGAAIGGGDSHSDEEGHVDDAGHDIDSPVPGGDGDHDDDH